MKNVLKEGKTDELQKQGRNESICWAYIVLTLWLQSAYLIVIIFKIRVKSIFFNFSIFPIDLLL